ncbi:glycolate oxidase subunit GlcF [Thermithiobacillus tepidarius DSM 3134]|uniref:glycolate oxidase subunit GlcF n=1 Tax=Thermithiobacillus tepidarius TaxID=929 RepID=UPI0004044E95|nr:glycolate oxidase subunit GlcF [Thermithiobacillus tepidarius]
MQTQLTDHFKQTPAGQEAESILRACVHCGFCTATCPTYQLLGDELDGPRGRIYLIKQVLEGATPSRKTQSHLDRCLTCRACESTCPSGVQYGRLADIGRELVEERVARPWRERLLRQALRRVIPYPRRFTPLLRFGQWFRPLLPTRLRAAVPPRQDPGPWPAPRHARRMLVLDGCAQPGLAPNINAAAARVLDRLGISLLRAPGAGCCGAVSYHLAAHDEGLDFMRRNIDAWWPAVESGAEAIVMTASGCGALVKEYGHLLRHDPAYAAKAARISALTRDIGEILTAEDLTPLQVPAGPRRIAFHAPCTLQHGQKLPNLVEDILTRAGFELTPVPDAHLCCGSAGTYSILQPDLSRQLRDDKLAALQAGAPALIATANIGCLTHLQGGTDMAVRHWIELLDPDIPAAGEPRTG